MKKQNLRIVRESLITAHWTLNDIKEEQIKARKKAKRSAKNKWTGSIKITTDAIQSVILAKQFTKKIPKRV